MMAAYLGCPGPGTVVSVPTHFFYAHKGIVSDLYIGGKPTVISNSGRHGGVYEEPWDVFTNGREWKNEGYPGPLPSWQVLHRARFSQHRPYHVLVWNCEHFVKACHGIAPESPQVAATLLCAAVGALVVARA